MARDSRYDRHEEATAEVTAEPATVFGYLDDHANLSSHMARPSWMMLGRRMNLFMDQEQARAVGSRFGFSGRILGVALQVEEAVIERRPPVSKTWETVGEPRLWVIGSYRMGFEVAAAAQGARLRVFIDYRIPDRGIAWLLGTIFGRSYARWCTAKMATDAARHFAGIGLDHSAPPS